MSAYCYSGLHELQYLQYVSLARFVVVCGINVRDIYLHILEPLKICVQSPLHSDYV